MPHQSFWNMQNLSPGKKQTNPGNRSRQLTRISIPFSPQSLSVSFCTVLWPPVTAPLLGKTDPPPVHSCCYLRLSEGAQTSLQPWTWRAALKWKPQIFLGKCSIGCWGLCPAVCLHHSWEAHMLSSAVFLATCVPCCFCFIQKPITRVNDLASSEMFFSTLQRFSFPCLITASE